MIRYLYKITNQINHKIYIGVHRSKRKTDSYMGSGLSIKNAIKKYGKENFIKEILEYFESDEDMFAREKEIVNEDFITNLENYNLIVGRKGVGAGHLHPMFGKKRPKHSEFMKTHSPSKGKPCPQSVKDKISQSNTGRKHSPEVNKKKGRSGDRNYFFVKLGTATGKKWINNGIESKLVSLSNNDIKCGWEMGRISISKKSVFKLDKNSLVVLEEYESLKEAGLKNNVSKNSISSCCAGRLKSAGGYLWKLK